MRHRAVQIETVHAGLGSGAPHAPPLANHRDRCIKPAAAATLRGVAGQLRQGAEWLPQVWRSTVPGATLGHVIN